MQAQRPLPPASLGSPAATVDLSTCPDVRVAGPFNSCVDQTLAGGRPGESRMSGEAALGAEAVRGGSDR